MPVTATGGEYRTLSHIRTPTFIGVMFEPEGAKPRKFATERAKCTLARDLLKGRRKAAWPGPIVAVFDREDADRPAPNQE
jgi:hypothetical protein